MFPTRNMVGLIMHEPNKPLRPMQYLRWETDDIRNPPAKLRQFFHCCGGNFFTPYTAIGWGNSGMAHPSNVPAQTPIIARQPSKFSITPLTSTAKWCYSWTNNKAINKPIASTQFPVALSGTPLLFARDMSCFVSCAARHGKRTAAIRLVKNNNTFVSGLPKHV